MTIEADSGAGAPCTSCGSNRLPFRTPEQYLAYAKRLQRSGSPRAPLAMRAAALAFATVRAGETGRDDLVRSGLAGLHAIALADPPPPVLDRAAIQAKFAELAHTQAMANRAVLATASTVVDIVSVPLMAAAGAIGNANDRALYTTVVQVVRWAVGSASGRTGLSFPTLPAEAVAALVGFCGVWNGSVKALVQAGVTAVAVGTALRDRSAAAAIETLGNVFIGVLDGLCSIPEVRAASAAVPPPTTTPGATNCADPCPRGQRRYPDPANQGQCGPCATPTPDRSPRRVWEIVARQRFLNEGFLKLPRPATPGPQQTLWDFNQRINCSTSCQLHWAETQYQASLGGGTIPELRPIPASGTPRRYFDSRTAPRSTCRCTTVYTSGTLPSLEQDEGGTSGGGAGGGMVVAAAVAAFALKFLL